MITMDFNRIIKINMNLSIERFLESIMATNKIFEDKVSVELRNDKKTIGTFTYNYCNGEIEPSNLCSSTDLVTKYMISNSNEKRCIIIWL